MAANDLPTRIAAAIEAIRLDALAVLSVRAHPTNPTPAVARQVLRHAKQDRERLDAHRTCRMEGPKGCDVLEQLTLAYDVKGNSDA